MNEDTKWLLMLLDVDLYEGSPGYYSAIAELIEYLDELGKRIERLEKLSQ